jgi:hypothetical protein
MDKGSSDGGERQIPTAGDADEYVWKGLEWSRPRQAKAHQNNSASKLGRRAFRA